jgi:hypothetical protein
VGTSASVRWLAGVGVALVVIVVLSLAVALIGRGERTYAEDTPEGTVQRYLRAVLDRDAEAALGYWSPELQERCEQTEMTSQFRQARDFRASLRGTREVGDFTEVDVRITERWGNDPFGGGSYTHQQLITLQEINGEWRITEPAWPIYWCPPSTRG